MTKYWAILAPIAWLMAVGLAQAEGIVIGQIGPFTGPAAADANDLRAGITAHFDQINQQGGVAGRKLNLFSLDDRYSGEVFAQQFEVAMQRKPLALLAPLGLGAMRALLDGRLLDKHDVVVVNAVPGATPFRTPGHARLFHVRAADRQQIEKIFRLATTLGVTKMSVIIQDKRAGNADVEAAQKLLPSETKLDLKLSEVLPAPGALKAAAAVVRNSDAEAVLVIGSPPYMAEAAAELRRAGVSQTVYALSYVPPGLIVRLAGAEAARGVSIAQTFPNPMAQTMPLHREFQSAMKASAPEISRYSAFHLEGYLSARALTEALKRTRSNATPAGLAATMRSMGPVSLGGFHLDFSKANNGSGFVDIAVINRSGGLTY